MRRRRTRGWLGLLIGLLLAVPMPAQAQGTVMPSPKFVAYTDAGAPCGGCLLNTYAAGTSTPLATYSDSALTAANTNPVVLDAAGRATIYLSPASYKFTLTTAAAVTIWTQDNVSAAPPYFVNLDIDGTAGEDLTIGEAVYLSDGSGSTTAGRWYRADADLTYASSQAEQIGVVPATISSGASGSIRLQGRITGLSGLTLGATHYVSTTAGDVTVTSPANSRAVGTAESTTTLVIAPAPLVPAAPLPLVAEGRLTLTTGTPVTTADVSAAATVYYAPYVGNRLALYDSTAAVWHTRYFAELSVSIATCTASRPYDVFAYDNSGTPALEILVWTNATTRATALTRQDGVLVKSGTTTRRYLGSFYCNSSGGQTDDTIAARRLWNYDHRVERSLRVLEGTSSWTYTTATWRQANGAAGNQVEVMVGVAEDAIELAVHVVAANSSAGVGRTAGIGQDATGSPLATGLFGLTSGGANEKAGAPAVLRIIPAVGRHFYAWIEYSEATGTTTWYGDASGHQAGLIGTWRS